MVLVLAACGCDMYSGGGLFRDLTSDFSCHLIPRSLLVLGFVDYESVYITTWTKKIRGK